MPTEPPAPPRMPLVRTLTLPSEANLNGGVFGGWVLAQMDIAAGLLGMRRAAGACTTVAIEHLRFLAPITVGEEFSIYGVVDAVGRTSLKLRLEGFSARPSDGVERRVIEALFVVVALDQQGRPRPVDVASAPDAP
jgi:acyl-CoA thioesterase YciA